MKKALYAVQGSSGLGKTETLNILVDLLSSVAYTYTIEKYHEYTNDRKAAFGIGNDTIVVYTAGDNEEEANSAIQFIKKHKAKMAFAACHGTTSTSRRVLKEFADENGYDFVVEQKQDDEKESRKLAVNFFNQIMSEV